MYEGKYSHRPRARKRHRRRSPIGIFAIALLLILAMVIGLMVKGCDKNEPKDTQKQTDPSATVSETAEETTLPKGPSVTATASVGVTGDMLGHLPLINSGLQPDGTYNFSYCYSYIAQYYEKYDFMVANLETTLGGGPYSGYPGFNSPDAFAAGLKAAGVDMLLTANNHTYDTRNKGFIRTQQVLQEMDMPYIGTRQKPEDPTYRVQDINGIKVGMVCYTYETGAANSAQKSLNAIPMTEADSKLITSFNYNDLEGFYAELSGDLENMKKEGAEVTMVYIHWGDEYALKQNARQTAIAQKLCEMGVDVIVGGHPHVIQPMDTLVSSTGHTTYCIYSVGNALSNQSRNTLSTANSKYTEDGVIFGVTFEKWSDGAVNVKEISILPTWVNRQNSGGELTYTVIPLDTALETWNNFGVNNQSLPYDSYDRTMSILGEGYNVCRETLGLAPAPMTKEQ